MELIDLGESGLRVSPVGLGCNNFGGRLELEETHAVGDAALDAGVTFFDTAEIYGNGGGSERLLGEILEGRRDRIVLATKFAWEPGEGPERASRVARSTRGSSTGSRLLPGLRRNAVIPCTSSPWARWSRPRVSGP